LTLLSCQSKVAFTVCFAACLLELCLRPESGACHLPDLALRILFGIRYAWPHREIRAPRWPALLHQPGLEKWKNP
jgi:hypothetical protein